MTMTSSGRMRLRKTPHSTPPNTPAWLGLGLGLAAKHTRLHGERGGVYGSGAAATLRVIEDCTLCTLREPPHAPNRHLHGDRGGIVDQRSRARGVAIGGAEHEVAQRCTRDGGKADGYCRLGAEACVENKAGIWPGRQDISADWLRLTEAGRARCWLTEPGRD
eukprot:scaffold34560_cov64-Phaeocystis_antarctica.AAC.1